MRLPCHRVNGVTGVRVVKYLCLLVPGYLFLSWLWIVEIEIADIV